MQLSAWMVYVWAMADKVVIGFAVMGAISAFLLVPSAIHYDEAVETYGEKFKEVPRRLATAAACFILLAVFVPSSKTIAIMYVAPAIANSEAIQQDVPELYGMAMDALKGKLKEAVKP